MKTGAPANKVKSGRDRADNNGIDGPGDQAAVESCELMEVPILLPRMMDKVEVSKGRGCEGRMYEALLSASSWPRTYSRLSCAGSLGQYGGNLETRAKGNRSCGARGSCERSKGI